MKTRTLEQNIVSFVVGILFAIGLALSGMTQPQKIINFLDPWNWDPSLLFVMLGAVGVHALSYPLIRRRQSPLLDTKWHVPTRQDLTSRLVLGSALFGIGWGLGGYCPGPGLASLASGDARSFIFVGAMLAGMMLFKKTEPHLRLRE
ncbi:MAG: YeeE/YedE family protein [Bdellovibrionaceae bacterium]|nr:YeeE/YedE family protein [Pseudobdellovibrionaceae bacterium]